LGDVKFCQYPHVVPDDRQSKLQVAFFYLAPCHVPHALRDMKHMQRRLFGGRYQPSEYALSLYHGKIGKLYLCYR